ncbi:HigA family addiction module antitoxin [Chitinophaga alhagiae]|uniref:HigA family addiction module antitoxin n=1 Tax=Chitinophaga alhagiae TaxID=2203219 RepID=UPI000E5C44A4|nr:HigA family addiction module antitoxin [Chitinophaga alhagiae]
MERKLPRFHPGAILREEVILAHGLTVTEAAKLLKVTRPALSNVLNGKAAISVEMSLRIAAVFGGTAEIWQRLQTAYDLQEAKPKIDKLKLKRWQPPKPKKAPANKAERRPVEI